MDAPVEDAFRRGWEISTSSDDTLKEKLIDEADRLNVEESIIQALTWERLYGGAGIFLGADDGRSVTSPLDESRVTQLHFLQVYDRWELTPHRFYQDPLSPKFGLPEIYRVSPRAMVSAGRANMLIHESRLVICRGRVTTKTALIQNQHWGQSVLVRAFDSVKKYGGALSSVLALLADASQGVYKIKNLAEIIRGGKGELLKMRMEAVDTVRSVINAIVLDADGESYERVATPLTELSNIIDRFKLDVASAAGMPVTKLFGQAPAGLNATGESDMRIWYDSVAQFQRRRAKPAIERILKLILKARLGPTGGIEPEKWGVKFPSPWSPTEKEQAEIDKIHAETDAIYVDLQTLTPAQVARARHSGDESTRIVLTPQELTQLESAEGALLGEESHSGGIELAPATVAVVLSVNEGRASQGLGPLLLPDGSPDPDGSISIAEYEAKSKSTGEVTGEAQTAPPASSPVLSGQESQNTDDEDSLSGEPLTLAAARELAQSMTEARIARCEHDKVNRCQQCGIERGRAFEIGPDGQPVWQVIWRAIGETVPSSPGGESDSGGDRGQA